MLDWKEAGRLAKAPRIDPQELGFRCGLEIHQQLDTRKLFSPCRGEVVDPDAVGSRTFLAVVRRLRATRSEMGEDDAAALAEMRRDRTFRYLAIEGVTSLVELDDEPPHPMSKDALDVTLTFAGLLGSTPAAEVHVMRKNVIDGSNTSGFQRTALVATGGAVKTALGRVGIWTVAVEEDSARKLVEEDGVVTYTLDRLGIPLIEVATAPDVVSPEHAQEVAARLGALLRATGRVKRGLGTIRQDLNVSIAVGERVEIKGCQDLRAIVRVIEKEIRRQLWMFHVAGALKERGFKACREPTDVSAAFVSTEAKLVKAALKRGHQAWGVRLPSWAGLVGNDEGLPRLGREFADHAAVEAGVKGIFHSDELPAYGISASEVADVRKRLSCKKDDAFVLVVEEETVARRALEAVARRAEAALAGNLKEVRAAQADDSTRYMRPLPGAARMYPETDVPPVEISAAHWKHITSSLPPTPEARIAGLVERHGVAGEQAQQLVADDQAGTFEALVAEGGEPKLVARVLLQVLPAIKGDVSARLPSLFAALQEGRFAKEAIGDVLAALAGKPEAGLDEVLAGAGLSAVAADEVEAICRAVVAERLDFVKERGMGSLGPLMGPAMERLRGRADGKAVSDALRKAITSVLA